MWARVRSFQTSSPSVCPNRQCRQPLKSPVTNCKMPSLCLSSYQQHSHSLPCRDTILTPRLVFVLSSHCSLLHPSLRCPRAHSCAAANVLVRVRAGARSSHMASFDMHVSVVGDVRECCADKKLRIESDGVPLAGLSPNSRSPPPPAHAHARVHTTLGSRPRTHGILSLDTAPHLRRHLLCQQQGLCPAAHACTTCLARAPPAPHALAVS